MYRLIPITYVTYYEKTDHCDNKFQKQSRKSRLVTTFSLQSYILHFCLCNGDRHGVIQYITSLQ